MKLTPLEKLAERLAKHEGQIAEIRKAMARMQPSTASSEKAAKRRRKTLALVFGNPITDNQIFKPSCTTTGNFNVAHKLFWTMSNLFSPGRSGGGTSASTEPRLHP
jgi:hypothetical protein